MSHSKKILFILTGSIAVYKAVTLVSRLSQRGHDLECVLTKSASKFIGRATIEGLIGKAAHSDLFDSENVMSHIHLIRDADAVIVAPGTANFINKIAHGLADDLASTLFLAHDFKKPFIIAPAMNTKMYEHPLTQSSLKRLKEMGVTILEAGSGILACGEVGYGKLLEPDIMLTEIDKILAHTHEMHSSRHQTHQRPRILITGGGTVEKIDDVRSLTNSSSGETSIHLAQYFYDLGLPVTLVVNNQKNLSIPAGIESIAFTSFNDLNTILKKQLSTHHYDYVIHAAAVSDFSLAKIEGLPTKKTPAKISSKKNIKLVLKPNFKIISKLGQYSKNKKVKIVGFKLTSHADPKATHDAVRKVFAYKHVSHVVQNDITQINRQKGIHRFSLFQRNGLQPLDIESRDQLMARLAQIVTKDPI
ncbi:MAG: bifunctional phosphopantothenoylcysteine decarboxylase/phosphopantothenate--cysteine ligase CoaBC [Bdellovibrionaceae bacterium]|nr:bifunctional phosphopantothenoylcysteine decarboxylase/phosphopantothenate--cysteine ligase CoaBC [Pseudobdellovibrionaceae bacterium]